MQYTNVAINNTYMQSVQNITITNYANIYIVCHQHIRQQHIIFFTIVSNLSASDYMQKC